MPRVPLPPQAGRHPARSTLQTERVSALTGIEWALVVILALSAVATISQVGKPRKPITPGVAATAVLIDIGLIVWIFLW